MIPNDYPRVIPFTIRCGKSMKIHGSPRKILYKWLIFHTALCAAGGIEPIVYPASMPKCEVGEVEGHPQVVAEKTIVKPWKNHVNPEPHFFRNFTILGWDLKIILRKNSCVMSGFTLLVTQIVEENNHMKSISQTWTFRNESVCCSDWT